MWASPTNARTTTSWTGIVPRKLKKEYSALGLTDMRQLIDEWAAIANQVVKTQPWHLDTVHLRTYSANKTQEIYCLHQMERRLFSRSFAVRSVEGLKHMIIAPHILIPDLSEAQIHIGRWGEEQRTPESSLLALAKLIQIAYNEESYIYSEIRMRLEEAMQLRRAQSRTVGAMPTALTEK